MTNSTVHVGKEYNTAADSYAGTYELKALPWKDARELIRKVARTKDATEYMEELVVASFVTGPVQVTKEKLPELPAGLVRRLIDEALRLNDISREESAFLSS